MNSSITELRDKRKQKEPVRWSELKALSLKIAEKLDRGHPDAGAKMKDCCSIFNIYKNMESGDFRIHRNRCKNRWCPICNHTNSGMMAAFLNQEYERCKANNDILFTMCFTCRNCAIDDLRTTLKQMSYAFTRLKDKFHRKVFIKACCRTLEFTWNREENNMHAHVHVLINFGPDAPGRREYIQMIDWPREFAHFLPDERCGWTWSGGEFGKVYSTWDECNNFLIKYGHTNETPFKSVVFEMHEYNSSISSMFEYTKYITKFIDLLDMPDDDFYKCYMATEQMQTRMFSGSWRKWKELIESEPSNIYVAKQQIRQNTKFVYVCSVFYRNTNSYFVYHKKLGNHHETEDDLSEFFVSHNIYFPPKLE